MNDAAPKPPRPVLHALNCLCQACIDARRDERLARQEELRGKRAAFFEATIPLAKAKRRRPQPGTLAAIARAYGRGSR